MSGPPTLWVNRYRRILGLIPEKNAANLLITAEALNAEARKLASRKYLS
jgi:hypothetical protein